MSRPASTPVWTNVASVAALAVLLCLFLPVRSVVASTQRQATDLVGFIEAETGMTVTEASVAQGEARIAYEQAHGATPEMLAADWLQLMRAANDFAPGLERVTIEVWTQGAMQLEVSAQATDIRAVLAGTLDPGAFMAGLSLVDTRPPEVALAQALAVTLGLDTLDVTVAGDEVTVAFFQPPVPDATVLMSGWYDILAVAAASVPDAGRITLLAQLSDGSTTTVTVPAADVRAYLAGELEADALLLVMSIVPGSSPLSGENGATGGQPGQTTGAGAVGELSEQSADEAPADDGSVGSRVLLVVGAAVCLTGLAALLVIGLVWRRRRRAATVPAPAPLAKTLDPTVCPHCGAGVTPGQRFCPECGGALAGGLPPPPR